MGHRQVDVLKVSLPLSVLALDIQGNETAEHGMPCAAVYSTVRGQKVLQKMTGDANITLEKMTKAAQKAVVQFIDDLSSAENPRRKTWRPRLVLEASGSKDKLLNGVSQ